VEYEQLFPGRQTYARYLHVAEAVVEDEAQAAWTGLGGRLKSLRREVVDVKADMKAGQSKAEAGQAEAKADMEEVKADAAEVKADVAEVKADVSELKTGQAEVKALLEQLVAQSLQNAA
jgi:predicted  nucleic acid-binding Zn-ribbon protein